MSELPPKAELWQRQEKTRARLRRWVREQVAALNQEFELPELAKAAVREFQRDPKFVEALFEETMYALVYDLAQMELAVGRRGAKGSLFDRWVEHANGRHVPLLKMTRQDLAAAATERRERGQHELTLAFLWDFIAAKMTDTSVVGDHYTPRALEGLYEAILKGSKPEEIATNGTEARRVRR